MTLRLLPGIAWALDESALASVRTWQAGISDQARQVFQVAACWEEFADIIETYRQQDFDATMLTAGLSLETQQLGRRVNVVVIASLPRQGSITWTEAEAKLADISKCLTLEAHRVLLHPTLRPLGEAADLAPVNLAELSFLRGLPWLLTRTVTGNATLGQNEFQAHIDRLLDALFLAEREGGMAPEHVIGAFFHPLPQPGCVRLAGFSRLPLDRLLPDLAQSLAHMVLAQAAQQRYDANLISSFENMLAGRLGEFLGGQRTDLQIEEGIPRELSRRQWPVAALLKEAPRIFAKEAIRLQREATVDQQKRHNSISLWQRLLAWFGRSTPPVAHSPDPLQAEALWKNLERMAEVLRDLADQAHLHPEFAAGLPAELCQDWTVKLRNLILQRLEQRWGDLDVLARLAWQIELDLGHNFLAALRDWEIPNRQIREFAAGLAAGNLLRFSAALQGALTVQAKALITSLHLGPNIQHGTQQVPCATLRLWPGRPSLLLAASEPVPVEHLHL